VDFGEGDYINDNDDSKKSYCKHCLEYGFKVPLRNRIYPNNEPIPVDHDQWKQCHECGSIVSIYELEKEASIKDVVETVDNPFDIGTSFLGIDSRTSVGGKIARKKRERQKELDDIKENGSESRIGKGSHFTILYRIHATIVILLVAISSKQY
jgi:hypothetical protein